MKIRINILFKIIILLAILICLGVNVYSDYTDKSYNIVLTLGSESTENSIDSHADSFDDDQINQTFEFKSIMDTKLQISVPMSCKIIHNLSFSVWQPPKIS